MTAKASPFTDTLTVTRAPGAFSTADLFGALCLALITPADATGLLTSGAATNSQKTELLDYLALADTSGTPIGAVVAGLSRNCVAAGITPTGQLTDAGHAKTDDTTGWARQVSSWARGQINAAPADVTAARAWLAGI